MVSDGSVHVSWLHGRDSMAEDGLSLHCLWEAEQSKESRIRCRPSGHTCKTHPYTPKSVFYYPLVAAMPVKLTVKLNYQI